VIDFPHGWKKIQKKPCNRIWTCRSLEAAVKEAAKFLNNAVKPVLVGGVKLRPWAAENAFLELADASGYPVAIQPHAKGMFPESHKRFIGGLPAPFTHSKFLKPLVVRA